MPPPRSRGGSGWGRVEFQNSDFRVVVCLPLRSVRAMRQTEFLRDARPPSVPPWTGGGRFCRRGGALSLLRAARAGLAGARFASLPTTIATGDQVVQGGNFLRHEGPVLA